MPLTPREIGMKHQRKTFGPIESLEPYVSPDWWRRIFNSLYLKTDADVISDQRITQKETEYFARILNLEPNHLILDLCCGQGRHTLELARRGFKNVEGLDRSHYLIQKARVQCRKEGLSAKFREGDARKLHYTADTFDVVMVLGNSFGYFESVQDDLKVLREIFRVLKPWGKVLLDVADGEFLRKHYQPRSWEWIDRHHYVCRERSLSSDRERLISREIIAHTEKGVIADQFYAERLYDQEGLLHLMREAGFQDVTLHSTITPESQRNQDLGMMERRLVVTGVVRKEWTPVKIRTHGAPRHVVVILGDPKKPDLLKPGHVFDDDDFYTIDQMKSALREIPGYKFTYLDNHDSLYNDLLRLQGKIDYVLNLCDEGFQNFPHQELYIPVLLEILGIPYTGAGPRSLAYCYDKSLVRGISNEMGIPVPQAMLIKPEDLSFELSIDFPVLVKPNFGDSSLGITQRNVAHSLDELLQAVSTIRDKFGYDKPILVEEFLTGSDLSFGILGNPPDNYAALPIIEEDYSCLPPELPRICGYEAKWLPDSPYWNIKSVPAQLSDFQEKFIIDCSLKLHERLECRDYTRFDWRLDAQGRPKLLEVNPNPGWCWDGHLAKMCKVAGISYTEMLRLILVAAEKRLGLQPINGAWDWPAELQPIRVATSPS